MGDANAVRPIQILEPQCRNVSLQRLSDLLLRSLVPQVPQRQIAFGATVIASVLTGAYVSVYIHVNIH